MSSWVMISAPLKGFSKVGGNLSGIHIDFMVGSEYINVDGILKNGDIGSIMDNGEWVF